MRLTLGALVALLLVLSACGGSDSVATTVAPITTTAAPTTTTADPNADLRMYVAQVMATELDDGELPLDESESACIETETFDAIGADRFVEVGFDLSSASPQAMATFDDLWTDAEWMVLVEGLFGCVDMEMKLRDSLAVDFDGPVAACVAEGYVAGGHLRAVMLNRADEGPDVDAALAELTALVERCSAG